MVAKPRAKQTNKKKLVTTVKRLIANRIETKQYFNAFTPASLTNTASYFELLQPANGTTDITRIGDKVRPLRLEIGISLIVSDVTQLIRLCVIQWFKNTTPTDAEVFNDTTNDTSKLMGAMNHDSQRSKILKVVWDRTYSLNTVSNTNKMIRKNLNLSQLRPTSWIAGASTNAIGGYFLVAMSDSSAIGHPTIAAAWRIRFKDA